MIGNGGRTQPNTVIEDDASSGNVETSGDFDPAQDGLDFYESLEGMLVQMNDLVATSYTFTNFGEIWVVGDNGANATVMSPRGALVISPGDLNPERMVIDDEMFKASGAQMPLVNAAAPRCRARTSGSWTGPSVSTGSSSARLPSPPTWASRCARRAIAAGPNKVSIATFNVENLSGGEPDAKYNTLAAMIVNNLAAPDIVGLEEIQDNNGAVGGTASPVVDANVTLDRLVAAIQLAGGPTYAYRQINPVAHQDGGEPGGNIRVGFLFRTDRGVAFVDRPGGDSTTPVSVVSGPSGPQLSVSPGRIAPADEAWTASRKPLAAEFTYNGHKLFVIVNHFNSKGGDQGLFGPWQPPVLTSEVQRIKQATLVAGFVGNLLAADPTANIAVVGDLNDFQFSPPVQKLKDGGPRRADRDAAAERAVQLRLRRQRAGARPHHGQRQPARPRSRGCRLRHRARQRRVPRPGVRPRPAARAADDAGADHLGVAVACRERGGLEQQRRHGQLHLCRPAVGARRLLPGSGDARL